jgi:CDP-diacylglycerol--glycerol-3-phosphate 3-phosphatidyltransferase
MISVYKIKPAFQKLLQPLLKGLSKMGVTANQITVFSILFSIGLGVLVYFHLQFPYFLVLVAFGLLMRMVFNALDGMMAKQYNMQSKLGEVLNEVGDIVSDTAIILPFIVISSIHPILIIGFAILSIMNEFAGILGKALGGARRYEGPMGKSDRALLIGLFCLVYYFWNGLALYGNWIFGVAIILVLVSTFVRLKNGLK